MCHPLSMPCYKDIYKSPITLGLLNCHCFFIHSYPFTTQTLTNSPLWCISTFTVPLATMSMPPLWSRSPEKFPWMPSALA